MSPKIMTDLLRGQMGFDGLVVTDALDMGGVTVRYPPGEVAVRSILAGADVLLVPPVLDAALAGRARGRGVRANSDVASRRSRDARASRQGQTRPEQIESSWTSNALARNFDRPEFDRAALDIADRGITLLRDDQHILPLDSTKPAARAAGRRFRRQRSLPGRESRKRNSLARRFAYHHAHGHALRARRHGQAACRRIRTTSRLPRSTCASPIAKAASACPTTKPPSWIGFSPRESPWSWPALAARIWRSVFLPPKPGSRRSAPCDVAQRAMGRALFGQTAVGGTIAGEYSGRRGARRGTRSRRESHGIARSRANNRKRNYSAPMTCSITPSPITRFPAACWRSATRMN